MKILKVLGILALGAGVIVMGMILFSIAVSVLHVAIPLAIIFAIGWVAYHVFFAGGAKPEKKEEKSENREEKKEAALPPKQGMSDEEAAKLFDQHREALGTKSDKKLGP